MEASFNSTSESAESFHLDTDKQIQPDNLQVQIYSNLLVF